MKTLLIGLLLGLAYMELGKTTAGTPLGNAWEGRGKASMQKDLAVPRLGK